MASRPLPFLFDLDGTLADTIADIAASTNHVRAAHDLLPLPLPAVRDLVGHGLQPLLRGALRERGTLDAAALAAAVRCYDEHHAQQCTRTAVLYPGVRAWLAARAALGHPLAVVTNKPERFARAIVTHLGLDDLLPVIVGGDTLPQRKPDPAPVRHALHLLGVPAAGTMVGDGETDVQAGRAAGLRTIACLFGYRDESLLRGERADGYWRAFGVDA